MDLTKTEYRNKGLNLDLYEGLYSESDCEEIFNEIEKYMSENKLWEINKEKSKFDESGEFMISEKRRTNQTFGDRGLVYELEFGGYKNRPLVKVSIPAVEWNKFPLLLVFKNLVSKITCQEYNFCVLQRYPNGGVGINPHRDNEMCFSMDKHKSSKEESKVETPKNHTYNHAYSIAGLSFGCPRVLGMVPPKNYKCGTERILLKPGSLYVMNPPTNDVWQHSIEKMDVEDENYDKVRFSLTFRNVNFK
jgi:alkylated DNA repair dioxygenase AlkB